MSVNTEKFIFDIEKFISEVKKYPPIWNVNSEDYRFAKRKQRAWTQIARSCISGFDELPDSEKVIACKKLNDKWRNLRDSFVRAKRINSKKTYMYATQLDFLKEVYKMGSQSESEEVGIDERPKLKPTRRTNRHFEDTWNSDDSNSEPLRNGLNGEEHIEYVNTFPEATFATNYSIEDEDKCFFDSLLPAVREFSLDQKLEFRSEVISLVKKIRSTQM